MKQEKSFDFGTYRYALGATIGNLRSDALDAALKGQARGEKEVTVRVDLLQSNDDFWVIKERKIARKGSSVTLKV